MYLPDQFPLPTRAAPAGECDFTFDRSGYRVPAIVISAWVAEGEVFTEEHRHTSLIATMRVQWDLGAVLRSRASLPG
jgi:phospholipase C